jgi:hypothetical protein
MKTAVVLGIVLLSVGAAWGQGLICDELPSCPEIVQTRLLSIGGGWTSVFIGVCSPYENGMYRIKTVIFNKNGKQIKNDDSGWFMWEGHKIGYEFPMRLLKGSEYFVRATVRFAPYIRNER